MLPRHEKLASGREIVRQFSDAGQLTSELHSHGILDVGLTMEFDNGKKVSEMYFVNRRVVSRARYEKARASYPDMPPADAALEDVGGALLKDVKRERTLRKKKHSVHVPDPFAAERLDAFCRSLIEREPAHDATTWIAYPHHTLGTLSRRASRKLVSSMIDAGALSVFACDIDAGGQLEANTGHLVIELPSDVAQRKMLLRIAARAAEEQGYEPYPDNGQRFVYVKLD